LNNQTKENGMARKKNNDPVKDFQKQLQNRTGQSEATAGTQDDEGSTIISQRNCRGQDCSKYADESVKNNG
jgi:hypothetical protein